MDRFARMLMGTLAVALVACGDSARAPERRSPAPATGGAAAPIAATGVAATPARAPVVEAPPEGWVPESPLPGLVALDPRAASDTALFGARADSSDAGTGLVGVSWDAPWEPGHLGRRSTLWLRREPRADAPPVAALVLASYRDSSEAGAWFFGPAGTRPNLVQYGDMQYGVPVDSVAGGWARGVVGWDTTGARVLGWADASDPRRATFLRWADYLAQRAEFFLDDSAARLYDSLDDTVTAGAPLPAIGKRDYTIQPLEVRGRWMRIRYRHPDAACGDEEVDTSGMQTREVWTPYLDRRGRPLVWWMVKGC